MLENVLGCKWSIQLLALIAGGTLRPSALRRACPGLSAKVMNERLRKLTGNGIVQRQVFGEKPPVEVEYTLTAFGERFATLLDEVKRLQDELDDTNS
ncbi:MAG: winged helix-turn-helix transcriptional regulator [Rhodothermales bacterium]